MSIPALILATILRPQIEHAIGQLPQPASAWRPVNVIRHVLHNAPLAMIEMMLESLNVLHVIQIFHVRPVVGRSHRHIRADTAAAVYCMFSW